MDELKPCEIPCPKCGSDDIHRVYFKKDSETGVDEKQIAL